MGTVGSFEFDLAAGRSIELYRQAKDAGSPRGLIVVAIKRASAFDEDMKPATSLANLFTLASGIVDEVTNGGYVRQVITSTGTGQHLLPAYPTVSAGTYLPLDLPDQNWGAIASGDDWTDLIICYAPDTSGADSTLIPLTCNHHPVSPDGSVIITPIADFLHYVNSSS